MRSSLSVVVAQPACVPGNLAANIATHAAVVRAAGARLVVFPELSLTGYVLDSPRISPGASALEALLEACRVTGTTALVGAPVREREARYIATLAVTGAGAETVYRKMSLGPDEEASFATGLAPAVLEIDGWRIGLGICKDTRITEHIEATLALGIDLYAAGLMHHPHELADQDARAARIIERGQIPVAFASAAGNAGPDYPRTAGHSSIWNSDGSVLARSGDSAGEFAMAILHAWGNGGPEGHHEHQASARTSKLPASCPNPNLSRGGSHFRNTNPGFRA